MKPVATAISIGSGGSFGAEGPIIMTGGAFGSVFSQFLNLASTERKTLLVAGAAGGMAAEDVPGMPVVHHKDPKRVIGILSKEDVFTARVMWFAEERNRERIITLSPEPLRRAANRLIVSVKNARSKARRKKNHSGESSMSGYDDGQA